jgi:hypothetical protein
LLSVLQLGACDYATRLNTRGSMVVYAGRVARCSVLLELLPFLSRFFDGKSLGQVPPFLVERFKRERKLTPVGEKQPRERAAATVNRELEILSKGVLAC